MHTYQRITIGDQDNFDALKFPALDKSLHETVTQLALLPPGPKITMLLSFVKNHCLNSKDANEHPMLALCITSKSLPLSVMEDLFEASRNNPLFRKDLETYISSRLAIPISTHQNKIDHTPLAD